MDHKNSPFPEKSLVTLVSWRWWAAWGTRKSCGMKMLHPLKRKRFVLMCFRKMVPGIGITRIKNNPPPLRVKLGRIGRPAGRPAGHLIKFIPWNCIFEGNLAGWIENQRGGY